MKKWLGRRLHDLGYDIINRNRPRPLPTDFEPLHREIYGKVKDFTMTSAERIYSLIEAVKYVETNQIPGAIVECGVWKGGSMMAVAETLKHLNNTSRELFLYDTFEGMSKPEDVDIDPAGKSARDLLGEGDRDNNLIWCYSTLESVQAGMKSTNYPARKIRYVKGKVEDSIPSTLPSDIALLRLDTDWYESTRHEMEHLFPLLVKGGVLILDDYGYWAGAKKAVDEYLGTHKQPLLLNRIDDTGRIAIKQI